MGPYLCLFLFWKYPIDLLAIEPGIGYWERRVESMLPEFTKQYLFFLQCSHTISLCPRSSVLDYKTYVFSSTMPVRVIAFGYMKFT